MLPGMPTGPPFREPEPRSAQGQSAIENYRTAVLGGHVEACEDCGQWRIAFNSCGNRHCPQGQGGAARTWLAEREAASDSLTGPITRTFLSLNRMEDPVRTLGSPV